MKDLELPELIYLNDFGGDFASYYEAVYQIFKRDFVDSKPIYRGKKLRLKAHPYIDGKEYTFYHFTHTGNKEDDRKPDLRRMERIAYPKHFINNSTHSDLKVWKNTRKNNKRILILHETERYLVVLDDRKDYILPWTAYYIKYNNILRKLLKEYEAFIKTNTAP